MRRGTSSIALPQLFRLLPRRLHVIPLTYVVAAALLIALCYIYSARQPAAFAEESKCYVLDVKGRLGNLMFQYAALAGLCVSRGHDPEKCAALKSLSEKNNKWLPINEFFSFFRISSPLCRSNGKKFTEHSKEVLGSGGVGFDQALAQQSEGTLLEGFFQSYRYFNDQKSREFLLRKFKFPMAINLKAKYFLSEIASKIPSREYKLVCMSCRRGDKSLSNTSSIYNRWALSLNYYEKALQAFKERHKKISVVVFTGGGVGKRWREDDLKWTNENIIEKFQDKDTVFFSDRKINADHFVSLRVLTLCPNLIISSSTYSWWAAYLAGNGSLVIAPKNIHDNLHYNFKDYYPPEWTLLDEESAARIL